MEFRPHPLIDLDPLFNDPLIFLILRFQGFNGPLKSKDKDNNNYGTNNCNKDNRDLQPFPDLIDK